MSIESIARDAYNTYRRGTLDAAPRWDELSTDLHAAFMTVAHLALVHGAKLQKRSQEQDDLIDEVVAHRNQ